MMSSLLKGDSFDASYAGMSFSGWFDFMIIFHS